MLLFRPSQTQHFFFMERFSNFAAENTGQPIGFKVKTKSQKINNILKLHFWYILRKLTNLHRLCLSQKKQTNMSTNCHISFYQIEIMNIGSFSEWFLNFSIYTNQNIRLHSCMSVLGWSPVCRCWLEWVRCVFRADEGQQGCIECVLLSFHLLNVQSQQRRLIDTRSCCGEHAMGIQHSMEEDSEEPSCSAKMFCK